MRQGARRVDELTGVTGSEGPGSDAPASVAGKRGLGWEVTGSEGPGSDAPASVAGKRGLGWEVTGSEGPGSHATRQQAAENRGKSSPPPTESKL